MAASPPASSRPRRSSALRILLLLALVAVLAVLLVQSKVLLIRGEQVSIASGEVTLAATMALPRFGRGPFPAAVIVQGSGPITANQLRSWGGRFVPAGMAILFYDKRGVGSSTGSFPPFRADCAADLDALASDAVAALDYLAGRADIDRTRIGLMGGSQAGWIMPLAASRSPHASFLVVLAGPAVSCGEIVEYQRLTGLRQAGAYSDEEIERRLDAFTGPHGFVPAPLLDTLDVPALWIMGERDRNVPTARTVAVLERARAHGAPIDFEVYRGGDHSLREVGNGRLLDPWPDIREWLVAQDVLRAEPKSIAGG